MGERGWRRKAFQQAICPRFKFTYQFIYIRKKNQFINNKLLVLSLLHTFDSKVISTCHLPGPTPVILKLLPALYLNLFTWRTHYNTDCWATSWAFLIQQVWDGFVRVGIFYQWPGGADGAAPGTTP